MFSRIRIGTREALAGEFTHSYPPLPSHTLLQAAGMLLRFSSKLTEAVDTLAAANRYLEALTHGVDATPRDQGVKDEQHHQDRRQRLLAPAAAAALRIVGLHGGKQVE